MIFIINIVISLWSSLKGHRSITGNFMPLFAAIFTKAFHPRFPGKVIDIPPKICQVCNLFSCTLQAVFTPVMRFSSTLPSRLTWFRTEFRTYHHNAHGDGSLCGSMQALLMRSPVTCNLLYLALGTESENVLFLFDILIAHVRLFCPLITIVKLAIVRASGGTPASYLLEKCRRAHDC